MSRRANNECRRRAREWYAEPVRPLSRGATKLRRALLSGLSQLELSLRVGCSQAMISAIACGRKAPRSYELVMALQTELGLTWSDWQTFDENRTGVVEAPPATVTLKASNER